MVILVNTETFTLTFRGKTYRCAIGKGGVVPAEEKKEGDGATPLGTYPLREAFYRPDKLKKPATGLPVHALSPDDLWCDESAHPDYNRRVSRPFASSHEELWRADEVYDLIVPLGYNDDPPRSGKGSAIFFHVARPAYRPTDGCVAVSREDMLEILAGCTPETNMVIE